MNEPTAELLKDWRYQCEERIRRWGKGLGVVDWHLGLQETLSLLDRIRDLERQLAEWEGGCINSKAQDRILLELRKLSKDSDEVIDGAGCDTGDPVDFTISEIQQAFVLVFDRRDEQAAAAEARVAALEGALRHADAMIEAVDYTHGATSVTLEVRERIRRALASTPGPAE